MKRMRDSEKGNLKAALPSHSTRVRQESNLSGSGFAAMKRIRAHLNPGLQHNWAVFPRSAQRVGRFFERDFLPNVFASREKTVPRANLGCDRLSGFMAFRVQRVSECNGAARVRWM